VADEQQASARRQVGDDRVDTVFDTQAAQLTGAAAVRGQIDGDRRTHQKTADIVPDPCAGVAAVDQDGNGKCAVGRISSGHCFVVLR
jgi:hypothetical protein